MREVPLIEDHRLADDDLLAVPNAPTLVPFRVADKHALDYMPLQFVTLIALDMGYALQPHTLRCEKSGLWPCQSS